MDAPQSGILSDLTCFRRVNKKILVITPRFPLPALGACEQDRLEGVKQLKRLGFEVLVVSKVFSFQDKSAIEKFSADFGIPVKLLEYENRSGFKRFLNPMHWDGAAYEYSHKSVKNALEAEIDSFEPDLAWVDYTYLWPLYGVLRKRKIPIITRSINFEPVHFLQEDGYSPLNLLKFLSKLLGEIMTIFKSDFLFAITPKEEKIYRWFGAKKISVLPLRGLASCLIGAKKIEDKKTFNVFFAGSTYSVAHNRKALEFILKKIAPAVEQKSGGGFVFHITGRKFPEYLKPYLKENVIYDGLVGDWERFLADMDIAMVPSLFGSGMQQKIFEPLSRGIPTIASSRGLAGYSFRDGEHLLLAESRQDFVKCILKMENFSLRQKLSENSRRLSSELFSREKLDKRVLYAMNYAYVRD